MYGIHEGTNYDCCLQYPLLIQFLSRRPVTNLLLYVLHVIVPAQFRTHITVQKHNWKKPQKLTVHVQFL